MTQKQEPKRPWATITIGVFAFFLGTAALSTLVVWQYNRGEEKKILKNQIEEQLKKPVQFFDMTSKNSPKPWQKIKVNGTWDESRSVLLEHQRHQDIPGWRLFTPLVLSNGQEVVVDRGWQAYPKERLNPNFEALQSPQKQGEVIGVVRDFPKRRGVLKGPIESTHPRVLLFLEGAYITKQALDFPLYIQSTTSTHADFLGIHSPLPSASKHQEYMLTWLALLIGWILIFGAALRAKLRGQ